MRSIDGIDKTVRRPTARRRLWLFAVIGAVVVIAAAIAGMALSSQKKPSEGAADAAAKTANEQFITVLAVKNREFIRSAPVSGEARPYHDVRVYAPAAGVRIAEVMAEIGDEVTEGQPLARLDAGLVDAQVQEAEAQVRQAEVEQKRSAEEYARIGPADKDAALSAEEIATRKAAADSAKAQFEAKKAALQQLTARVQGGFVLAPSAGLVIERNARVGEYADQQALFRIVGGDRLEVAAEVAEPDILSLKQGQVASFTTSDGEAVKATLRVPPVAVDSAKRTGMALFDLPKAADIRSGMYLRGEVVVQKMTALAVPLTAISYASGSPSVFVIKDGKAHLTPVKLGVRTGDYVAVLSGLREGDSVAAAGGAFLLDGDTVRTVSAGAEDGAAPQAGG